MATKLQFLALFVVCTFVVTFSDAATTSRNAEQLKDAMCWWRWPLGQKLISFSQQMEYVQKRGLDVSSCQIGIIDKYVKPTSKVTLLEAVHLISDKLERDSQCLKKIIDSKL